MLGLLTSAVTAAPPELTPASADGSFGCGDTSLPRHGDLGAEVVRRLIASRRVVSEGQSPRSQVLSPTVVLRAKF